jgi:hypothetical protein
MPSSLNFGWTRKSPFAGSFFLFFDSPAPFCPTYLRLICVVEFNLLLTLIQVGSLYDQQAIFNEFLKMIKFHFVQKGSIPCIHNNDDLWILLNARYEKYEMDK